MDFLHDKGSEGKLDFEWCSSTEKMGRTDRELVPWFNVSSEAWETRQLEECPKKFTARDEDFGHEFADSVE